MKKGGEALCGTLANLVTIVLIRSRLQSDADSLKPDEIGMKRRG
jgi:hypothetical protein